MDYLTIWLRIIKEFKISANDALVLEFIYKTSTFPESKYPGWCYASKIYIAELMNISMRTLYYIFNTLEEKQLIDRDEKTGFLRTTKTYNDIHFLSQNKDEEFADGVQKLQSYGAKIAVGGVQKLHTIIKEENKKENIYNVFLEKFNSLRKEYLPNSKGISRLDLKTKRQLKSLLKTNSIDELIEAATKAFDDPFHKDSNFKYVTPEYITRDNQFVKWFNCEQNKQSTRPIYG